MIKRQHNAADAQKHSHGQITRIQRAIRNDIGAVRIAKRRDIFQAMRLICKIGEDIDKIQYRSKPQTDADTSVL